MRSLLPLGLLVLLLPVSAASQYMYLDTNGNGIRDSEDRLAPSGPTQIDVWLITNQNRDGTPVVCDVDAGAGMTLNSYTLVLHATGGEVKWGPMENHLPFSTDHPACFASYEDTTGTDYYHNGWGYLDKFPPGKYRLATLTVEVTSGTPSLVLEPFLPRRTVLITQFGTICPARGDDNTYALGLDWTDVTGLGPLRAAASGPYRTQVGRVLPLTASGSQNTSGEPITFHWDFGDGGSAVGENPTHVYAAAGDYTVVLLAESAGETDTDTALVHVVPPVAPIAVLYAPRYGYVGTPFTVDGRGSSDPEGDALSFFWEFGDGDQALGATASHAYAAAGVYTLHLTVSNGPGTDTASQEIAIRAMAHAPIAVTGGPYTGIVDRTLLFKGIGSSDQDGDELSYTWTFGDQMTGYGLIAGHAYSVPGNYGVRLTVSDGTLSDFAVTTATIANAFPARAFGDSPLPSWEPGSAEALTVHVEPIDDTFRIEDVDPGSITMRSPGTGSVEEIYSVEAATITEDSDGNQARELTMTFSPEELALLLGGIPHPGNISVGLRGGFFAGGSFAAELKIHVKAGRPSFAPVRISPNPFNPEAVVTFGISKPGPVRARLFDVHGRLVRTVLDEPNLGAGTHTLSLPARSGGGGVLASGIYFFQLTGPDGISTKRVAVAK